jgi:hypothetical protein
MKTTTLSPATAAALEAWEAERKKAEEPAREKKRVSVLKEYAVARPAAVAKHARLKKDQAPVIAELASIDAGRAPVVTHLQAIERDTDAASSAIGRLDADVHRTLGPLGGEDIDRTLPQIHLAARQATAGLSYRFSADAYGNVLPAVLVNPELLAFSKDLEALARGLTAARLDPELTPGRIEQLCREAREAIAKGPMPIRTTAPNFRFPTTAAGLK